MALSCKSPIRVDKGGNFSCECRGEGGNPPANVTWYKDGKQINKTSEEEQQLNLKNVGLLDNGTYKCVARSHENDLPRDEKSILVLLNRE